MGRAARPKPLRLPEKLLRLVKAAGRLSPKGNPDARSNSSSNRRFAQGATRLKIPFVNPKTANDKKPFPIKLGYDEITLTCYCANGILADGENVVEQQKKKKQNRHPNPNDLSLAFVLKWGDFRYFTAGDLSGDTAMKSYYDVETGLVKYLREKKVFPPEAVTIFKASHHGSEHSNQAELLKFMNPQTIVVSVNDDKDVPHHVFLERLNNHFKTNAKNNPEAMVVFSNWLTVHYGDVRLAKLKALQDAKRIVEKNLIETTNETLTNQAVKSVVIRRRVNEGNPVAFDDVPKPSEKEHSNIVGRMQGKNNHYEIVMIKRADDEASTIEKQSTPKTFKLEVSWLASDCAEQDIENGFLDQAKTLAYWFTKDQDKKDSVGKDYVEACYPAFTKQWSEAASADVLKTNVYNDMMVMFGKSFTSKGARFGSSPKAAELSGKQRQTIHNLLKHNSRQQKFNEAAYKEEPGDIDYWNEVGGSAEPHGTTTGVKRKPQEQRKSKRPVKKPKK